VPFDLETGREVNMHIVLGGKLLIAILSLILVVIEIYYFKR